MDELSADIIPFGNHNIHAMNEGDINTPIQLRGDYHLACKQTQSLRKFVQRLIQLRNENVSDNYNMRKERRLAFSLISNMMNELY